MKGLDKSYLSLIQPRVVGEEVKPQILFQVFRNAIVHKSFTVMRRL